LALADLPLLVAVITATPGVTASMTPELETVAIARFELSQRTLAPTTTAPAASSRVTVSWAVSETLIERDCWERATEATGDVTSITGALPQLAPPHEPAIAVIATTARASLPEGDARASTDGFTERDVRRLIPTICPAR
jgi:hypothetical protein